MKTLTVTDEAVKKAAEQCPAAKEVFRTMFPEVFDGGFKGGDIVRRRYNNEKLFMVLDGSIKNLVEDKYKNMLPGCICITDGYSTWSSVNPNDLIKVEV